jgi:hypothetical protein
MSVGIDYILRRPYSGSWVTLIQEMTGSLEIEYDRMSVDRIRLSFPIADAPELDLYPLSEITLYVATEQGQRLPFARGWLTRRLLTPTLAVYEFTGARGLLNLVTVQGIFTPGQTVRDALVTIITRAQQVLASTTNGANISDWVVGSGIDASAPFVALLSPVSAADAIAQLERAFGDWLTVTFGFSPVPDSPFTVTAQSPPAEVLLLDAQPVEIDERYENLFNRVAYLMESPSNPNVIPNPDFSAPAMVVGGEAPTNLVPNPSFETYLADWQTPSPPIYWEWDWNYGYTGTRNFKFHDCHEYSSSGWLTSGFFPVSSGVDYAGGFALGCDPLLAQECGGPSTVKVRVQVLGFNASNTQTETAYDQEITNIFHSALHWHWIPIPPFRFTNANTVKAKIRFNTFHGKRLYLDEVQVYRADRVYQRDWRLQPDSDYPPLQPGTNYDIDWLRPLGISEGKHVVVSLSLPSSRSVELQSTPSPLLPDTPTYVLTLFSDGLVPAVSLDWYNEQGNSISSGIVTLTVQDTIVEDGITWTRRTSAVLSRPAGAYSVRVRLTWTGVSGQARVRSVLVAPASERRPYRYGYAVTPEYQSGQLSYGSGVDPEIRSEAADSETIYGVLPTLRVRDTVIDSRSAEIQASADFLRFAVAERRIEVKGILDDYRLLYPHLFRLRVPSVIPRSLLLLSLRIHPTGEWHATLGTPQADLRELLQYLTQQHQQRS